ncbi:hypothetical protein TNCV_1787351 [Trichonephila clavipes]|nr:hypothetical protein TNCV_1787351 [Trichonephila clavipes]
MKSLVYKSPVDSDEALVARIAVIEGEIREMPGVFANVRRSLRQRVAAWSMTPSPTTPSLGITELCSEGKQFQISPPEHYSACAT